MPVSWTTRVLAAGDQVAVDGDREDGGDGQGEAEAAPEEEVAEAGVHRAGDGEDDEVVDDLHGGDAERVGGERDRDHGAEGEARPEQRQAGQPIAEDEGEGDREQDGAEVREARGGADRHAGDLADRAAGQAVQGGGDRDPGEGARPGRHRMATWLRAPASMNPDSIPPMGIDQRGEGPSAGEAKYIPAARWRIFNRVYDPVIALTMRERRWRGPMADRVSSDLPEGGVAVDVGCGTGTFAIALPAPGPTHR